MISEKDILDIICTEAIEYGGLPEIPGHQHGVTAAFHAAKRLGRGKQEDTGTDHPSRAPSVGYRIRVVKRADGSLRWED